MAHPPPRSTDSITTELVPSTPESLHSSWDRAGEAAQAIRSRSSIEPRVGVILGSGLGAFGDSLDDAVAIPYPEIPHWPHSSVIGHAGRLILGRSSGVSVVACQGRAHYYEGYQMNQVVSPIRTLFRLGVRSLVVTNAAGAINREFRPGSLMLIRDHVNLIGSNPMIGPNDDRFGPRFFDMTEAYDPGYRRLAREEARRMGLSLVEGVYLALSGPSYETPAEIRMLATLGADAVGMSTVPEVIAARHSGLKVLGISCLSNAAAGTTDEKLNHDEVLETGKRVAESLIGLLQAIIPKLD